MQRMGKAEQVQLRLIFPRGGFVLMPAVVRVQASCTHLDRLEQGRELIVHL